jgi:hypothetical protein
MKKLLLLLLGIVSTTQAQSTTDAALPANLKEMSYNEYLGFVKKYHPLVKNANLEISKAQANLTLNWNWITIKNNFKEPNIMP